MLHRCSFWRHPDDQQAPSQRQTKHTPGVLNAHAGRIDCGATAHYVAVDPSACEEPVRRFTSFTHDLRALADWLSEAGLRRWRWNRTGVYWIALYDLLEERGFEVLLVNARAVKHVPGRKSDVADCQWLPAASQLWIVTRQFPPQCRHFVLEDRSASSGEIVRLSGDHVRRMQKSLVEMNLHLHNVISDITV